VINTLMGQAALPVPSFEVANTPMNVPMVAILIRHFSAAIECVSLA
jgi:hypothetical protein